MYSPELVEVHFWLALAGAFVYVFAMWNSGIIQGLMWRTYDENGTLAYSFVALLLAMPTSYVDREVGGLRSEVRRGGKMGVSTCNTRQSANDYKKKKESNK